MTSTVVAAPARRLPRELVRAARPRQWVKNLLVLAAPVAAGVALQPAVMARAGVAMLAMTATAAGCYLVNDVADAELDRQHPRKRLRPVASGAVPEPVALAVAALALLTGVGLAAAVSTALAAVVALYAALTLSYALLLKGVPWVELAVVASGFLLRAWAGAVAGRVDATEWFLLVVSGAAIHVVASKRSSELVDGDETTRPVLRAYSIPRLRVVRAASAALLVGAYAGWAANRPGPLSQAVAWVSLLAIAGVLVRWTTQTERGATEAPEDALVHDRWIRAGVVAWAVCWALSVAAGTWGR